MVVKAIPFNREEFQARLGNVRKAMEQEGLDGLVVMSPEDMYWITGYRSMGYYMFQALVINYQGEPVMISRKLEEMIFLNNSWSNTFKEYYDYEDPVMALINVLQDMGLIGKKIGMPIGSSYLKPVEYLKLTEKMPNTKLVDTTMLVANLRWVKSPAEIAYIRKAAKLTNLGTIAGIEAAHEGGSENDIAAAFLNTMILNGSEDPAAAPLVGSGPRSAFGHAQWENRELEKGDLIFLEGGGCVSRYHAGVMRTISIGTPSKLAIELQEACKAGLKAAIEALKPGSTSGEVDTACRKAIEDTGMSEYFRHRAGYSIGIGFTTWIDGFSIKPNDPSPIKENMVFHIVPFLSTGDLAVAISETVLVTSKGGEALVNLERKIFVR